MPFFMLIKRSSLSHGFSIYLYKPISLIALIAFSLFFLIPFVRPNFPARGMGRLPRRGNGARRPAVRAEEPPGYYNSIIPRLFNLKSAESPSMASVYFPPSPPYLSVQLHAPQLKQETGEAFFCSALKIVQAFLPELFFPQRKENLQRPGPYSPLGVRAKQPGGIESSASIFSPSRRHEAWIIPRGVGTVPRTKVSPQGAGSNRNRANPGRIGERLPEKMPKPLK